MHVKQATLRKYNCQKPAVAIVSTASLDTDSRDASARWAPSGPLMKVVLPRRKLSGFLNALSSEAQLQ